MFIFDFGTFFGLFLLVWFFVGLLIGVLTIPAFFLALFAGQGVLTVLRGLGFGFARIGLLLFRSLRRNVPRTALTFLAIFVLVFVVAAIWSILAFLDEVSTEKEKDFKVIVTEKFQFPSQMPPRYERDILAEIAKLPEHLRPADIDANIMTWTFVLATTDPEKRTFESMIFFFAMDPKKFPTMMDGLEEFSPDDLAKLDDMIAAMERNKRGVVVGPQRLELLNKQVGDTIKATCLNYKDLEFELEIIGTFPKGTRYDQSSLMHRDYLFAALEDYERQHGEPHPLEDKTLNLIWVKMPTREAYEILAERVNSPGAFSTPAVKLETASSGISTWFEPYKDLLWGMKWLLSPAILATMALVIANAISISVRERRTEMAVLKVLGFRPWQVLALVLSEALLVGALSGLMSGALAYGAVAMTGGIPFPIAFFPKFGISVNALWWGPALGAATALAGSLLPAWSARSVKASEVFARVA